MLPLLIAPLLIDALAFAMLMLPLMIFAIDYFHDYFRHFAIRCHAYFR